MPRSSNTGDANETLHARFCGTKTTKDEICDTLQEVSYEEKKLIKTMNQETKKVGKHYQTPFR